jgi:protein-disulfide isomerase
MNQYLTRAEVKQKRNKSIILWSASVLLVALSVLGIIALNKASEGSELGGQISATDGVFGNPAGKVELIEYSDLQCPGCAAASPNVKRLLADYPELKFVYRHFPLKSIHPNAMAAAKAAEAAGVQGKFLEMTEILFINQNAWKDSPDPGGLFLDYAQRLGLDTDQFARDMRSKDIEAKIESDIRSGLGAKVNGTPTFFLNGNRIITPATYEGYKKLIDEAINEK